MNWGGGTRKIHCGLPAAMAMPRLLSKSVAGGANVVLTADEQRRDILILTGALTANINVEVDATPWSWPIVHNNTSGAYTLTVKVTGQTGVAVAQGARVALACDGTDVRRVDPIAATQAEMEAGLSTRVYTSPGTQHLHPSAAKAWGSVNFSGTVQSSFNVSSVTDAGLGNEIFNWTTPFSSAAYTAVCTVVGTPGGTAASTLTPQIGNTMAVGSTSCYSIRMSDFAGADGNLMMCVAFGDQ